MKPNEHEFKVMGMAPYAKKEYSKLAVEVSDANKRFISQIEDVKSSSVLATRAAKSASNEIKDQLIKIENVVGNVEIKVLQLERIAEAMKVIHAISKDEVTMSAISALSK